MPLQDFYYISQEKGTYHSLHAHLENTRFGAGERSRSEGEILGQNLYRDICRKGKAEQGKLVRVG